MNESENLRRGDLLPNRPEDVRVSEFNQQPAMPIAGREVLISPRNYGYVVMVGCQSFCIEKSDKLIALLRQYLNDPKTTEELWVNGKLNMD